jgi:outer membrane protein OmpA-like peptidoglycan-associated protein
MKFLSLPKFWIYLLLGALSTQSFAAEVRDELETIPMPRQWLYFGGNAGYSSVNTAQRLESNKNGYQFNVKLLGSQYWRDWVGDLGVGYFYNRVSGTDLTSNLIDAKVYVRTKAAFLELSPRYRFNENWQLGPVVNGLFGTDVSFDESETVDNKKFALMAGLRLQYEVGDNESRWRFGAQAMKDFNVSNRNVLLVQADIQYGIPLGSSKATEPKAEEAAPVVYQRPVAPRFAEVTAENNVKIYLGEAVLRFKTAKSELRPSSREILAKLSTYLVRNGNAWKSMRIEGHADKRGKVDYNFKLALARANRVKSELNLLGVANQKMSTKSYGITRPIDPADDLEAYALNRRVEIWLDGVSDAVKLTRDLNELK